MYFVSLKNYFVRVDPDSFVLVLKNNFFKAYKKADKEKSDLLRILNYRRKTVKQKIKMKKNKNFVDIFFHNLKFNTTCKAAWQLNYKEFQIDKEIISCLSRTEE